MERFLLFDSGCSLCTDLARAVQCESRSQLKGRSLREPDIQILLDRSRPGWRWEPTLLEVDGENVKVFTRLALRAQLLRTLGPRKTWNVLRAMTRVNRQPIIASNERRWFVHQSSLLLTGLLIFGLPVPDQWKSRIDSNGQDSVPPPKEGPFAGGWPTYGGHPVPPVRVDPSKLKIMTAPTEHANQPSQTQAQSDSSCCACPSDGANPCGCCCGTRIYPTGSPYWASCWNGCCTPCSACCWWCTAQYWEVQPWAYQCSDGQIRYGAVPTGNYSCGFSGSCC